MSFRSTLQNRRRKRTFRKIRNNRLPISDLPPYERGLYYEDFVCRWLKKQGYHILDRNYRARKRSEIDLVAKKKETMVFIEIKARRRHTVYSPLRAIDETKRRSLSYAVSDYLQALEETGIDTEDLSVRYDVIALFFDRDGVPGALDHHISYLEQNHEYL